MKQVWITRPGPPEVLEVREAASPIPRSGEVRLRVAVCGVNFSDVLGRMDVYPDAPSIPYVPGFEVAGTVDQVGQGVSGLKEGDEVLAFTRFGGYSDLICVPHRQVFKRLEWMSAEDGAALPVNYLAAYAMLVVMGSLQKGDRVLVHGAGGGIGQAAVDICRIMKAEVYGTASPYKLEFLKERGVDHPIDYRNYDYETVVRDLTGGRGVHLVLDDLGGQHWQKNYRLLMPTGRVIFYGISSLVPTKQRSWVDVARGMLRLPFFNPVQLINDNKGIMGFNWARLWEQTDMQRQWMARIFHWYDEALFRPSIDRTFQLREAAAAHNYLQERQNKGKVLLVP